MLYRWKPMAKYFKLYEEFDKFFLDNCTDFGVTREQKKMLEDNALTIEIARNMEQLNTDNHVSQKVFK
jgi:hypothetical protein